MKLTILGLCTFVAVFSGAMTQALPHYNGVVITRDESTPFIAKISARINTAAITPEQREKEATEILHQSQDNFRQCEQIFGGNPTMIGGLKGCLGRFTGIAMSQISVLESFNRGNIGANNDPSLLLRNSNLRNSNIRLQNTNLNTQHTNKFEESKESNNDNLNRRNSNLRSQNRNSNEQQRFIKHQSIDSDEVQNESRLKLKVTTERPSERLNSRNKHINKHSNESRENRNNRSSNESL